jgi:threonine synthase
MLVSEEITAEIGAPDVLICPVGNGTTLAGIFKGFVTVQGVETPKHYGATTVENRFVGGRPSNKMDWDLEPLRSAEPLDEVAAMRAISTTGGRFIGLSRRSMLEATRLLWETEHIRCHPASAIVIAAAHSLRISGELRRDEDIVAILTTGE